MNAPDLAPFDLFDAAQFSATAYDGTSPEEKFVLEGRYPEGKLAVVAGLGEMGKSWLMLQVAEEMGGRGIPCLIIFSEDSRADVDRRLRTIRRHVRHSTSKNIYITTGDTALDWTLIRCNQFTGDIDEGEALAWVERILASWYAEYGRAVLIVDNFSTLFQCDPNRAEQVNPIMARLRALGSACNTTIILLHHFTKGDDQDGSRARIRGSGGITDAARCAYTLSRIAADDRKVLTTSLKLPGDADIICLRPVKSNSGIRRVPTFYKREEDGFLTELPAVGFISLEDALIELIRNRPGAFTRTGKGDGLFAMRHDGWPGTLGTLAKGKLEGLAARLIDEGRITTDASSKLWVASKDSV